MESKNLPAEWTDKQRDAYRLLTERASKSQATISNGTPKGGWTEADKVAKR